MRFYLFVLLGMLLGRLRQELLKLSCRQGLRPVIALSEMAAEFFQLVAGGEIFHTLCDAFQFHDFAHTDNGADNVQVLGGGQHVANKRHIDLQSRGIEFGQIIKV